MTMLNVLLTDKKAWLAQDHGTYRGDNLPSYDTTAADYALKPQMLGEAEKLATFHEQKLIVGCVGSVALIKGWLAAVNESGCDIDGLRPIAPITMRNLVKDATVPELRIVHVGYSAYWRKVTGVLYDWRNNFMPTDLPAGSVVHQPEMDADAPGADKLNKLSIKAQHGNGVRRLFDALFANQQWQYKHKRVRAGVAFSDGYSLASVDKDGITSYSLAARRRKPEADADCSASAA